MAQTIDGSDPLAARANELYWSGGRTVDEIVEELGISRTALYSAIEPAPAGLICADCQVRMVHNNRTMRERGVAICPNCGRESEPGETEPSSATEFDAQRRGRPAGRGRQGATAAGRVGIPESDGDGAEDEPIGLPGVPAQWRETLKAVPPQRIALVGGGAALGVMLGAFAAHALREGR